MYYFYDDYPTSTMFHSIIRTKNLCIKFPGIFLSFLVHTQIVLTKGSRTHRIFYIHYLLKSIIFVFQYEYNNIMSLIGCCFYFRTNCCLLVSALKVLTINCILLHKYLYQSIIYYSIMIFLLPTA